MTTHFGNASLYRVAAVAQILFVAVAALFLREQRFKRPPRPKLTVKRYINDMWGDPTLRRFGMLAFTHAIFVSSISGFVVLYAVKTVGIDQATFGDAWSWTAMVSLVCAIPLGVAVQRIRKSHALALGYGLAMGGCVIGLFAAQAETFIIVAVIFGLGTLAVDVTLKPFFTEFLPVDLVGQLSGAYNICFAIGRSLGSVGAGAVAWFMGNDYHAVWIFALVFGAFSIVLSLSIRDRGFEARHRT
jgi:Na+/melibiose symporter-like transporter